MSTNAPEQLFWPGLDAQLRQTRAQYKSCNRISSSQPEEHSLPQLPFQDTVVDMQHQKIHLLHICGLIHRVEAALMSDANAKKECNQWHIWFCTFGSSEEHHSKTKSKPSFRQLGNPLPPLSCILCTEQRLCRSCC